MSSQTAQYLEIINSIDFWTNYTEPIPNRLRVVAEYPDGTYKYVIGDGINTYSNLTEYGYSKQEITILSERVPIGFSYIQFPGMKTPTEANFYGTWEELNFGGAFFRSKGGNALPFDGGVQGDAIRNIAGGMQQQGDRSGIAILDGGLFYNHTGRTTKYADVGGGSGMPLDIRFDASRVVPTANENRPVNYTIRIWLRTA